jgi:dihydroflavonol-4-reductase
MAVVVTGAAGHLGASLVRALRARGQAVRALVHRDRRALDGLDVEIVSGDVVDEYSLQRAFADADTVYHAAAYISISMGEREKVQEVNVLGTRNVVEACQQCGVQRLVYVSSIEVLQGEPFSTPVDESRPLIQPRTYPWDHVSGGPEAVVPKASSASERDPSAEKSRSLLRDSSPYARSKAAAERLVWQGMARGLDAIILYPTAMIGPYDYRKGFPNAGLLAICEGRLWALVEGGFNWVDVRDVAQGALRAAEQAPAGAKYILSGHRASLHDLALLASAVTGAPVPRLVFPMWMARIGAPFAAAASRLAGRQPLYTSAALMPLVGNRNISHARATRELGYQPRPLRETVVETLQWFEKRGVLARQLPLPVAGSRLTDSPAAE